MKNIGLILILAGYFVITLAYGIFNPLFEAPDEHWHFFTAVFIAENKVLPLVEEDYDTWLSQEAAQPPLYYLLGAALISPIDTSSAREQVWLNPFGTQGIGNAAALTNRNQIIHTAAEQWPWTNSVLAAHLLRFFSTLLGLGTLLAVYASARLFWPDRQERSLLTVASIAFLPQFNFQHAAVSNDPLIIFLSSAVLWQLIWLWKNRPTAGRLLLLGVTIGLAILSKNAGILLFLFAMFFLLLFHLQGGVTGWQEKLWLWSRQTAVYLLLPVLLLAGWLWWRNWQLYGDLTATNQFIHIAGGDRGYNLGQVLAESNGLWRSLFAVFGWFNLLAPPWVYWLWSSLVLLGMGGLIRSELLAWRNEVPAQAKSWIKKRLLPLLLAGWFAVVYTGLVLFMLRTPAAQGRLLFPAILPLALGLAYGLDSWGWRPLVWLAPAAALFTTVYSLAGVIIPFYQAPPVVAALPDSAIRLEREMGAGLTLLGVEMETETAVPGDILWFTLYWQAEEPPTSPPELVIDVLGRDLEPLGNSHSYHGRGMYPATEWPDGEIVADRMGIRLKEDAAVPVLARLFVHLLHEGRPTRTSQPVGSVKVRPDTWPAASETILAEIGEAVQLTAVGVSSTVANPGETILVEVTWQVVHPPQANWTTLIHLGEPGQKPLATGDSQPLGGDYPTTVWAAGEIFDDFYTLTIPEELPDGRYPILIGMYQSDSIERLPLTAAGEPQPHRVYQVTTLEIVSP